MRGQWESQTRKLNRHYQSSGNIAEKTWDGSKDLFPADKKKKGRSQDEERRRVL